MDLWDRVVDPHEVDVSTLSAKNLVGLALDVIKDTATLFEPVFEQVFPGAHRQLVNSLLQSRDAGPAGWADRGSFFEQYLARYDELPPTAVVPAVGPFMTATVRLAEGIVEKRFDPDGAMEVLSSCYESILMSRLSGRIKAADEEADPVCRRAVQGQLDAIAKYVR
ncbi:hypothetical protein AB0C12_25920 [Actinoplanes sp. NPDC048967]|uniref:hypothetical protein n=1 Tax=Actinoplanes sp. NPDC048967 TaxID=3155269 RepID=UPI0033F3678A